MSAHPELNLGPLERRSPVPFPGPRPMEDETAVAATDPTPPPGTPDEAQAGRDTKPARQPRAPKAPNGAELILNERANLATIHFEAPAELHKRWMRPVMEAKLDLGVREASLKAAVCELLARHYPHDAAELVELCRAWEARTRA
jgi:hypothetical protein